MISARPSQGRKVAFTPNLVRYAIDGEGEGFGGDFIARPLDRKLVLKIGPTASLASSDLHDHLFRHHFARVI